MTIALILKSPREPQNFSFGIAIIRIADREKNLFLLPTVVYCYLATGVISAGGVTASAFAFGLFTHGYPFKACEIRAAVASHRGTLPLFPL